MSSYRWIQLLKNYLFEILNLGNWDLPFDSFDLEALDRLAKGGELVEQFVI